MMISHFEMIDMRLISYFLGIEEIKVSNGIFILLKKYESDMLK